MQRHLSLRTPPIADCIGSKKGSLGIFSDAHYILIGHDPIHSSKIPEYQMILIACNLR